MLKQRLSQKLSQKLSPQQIQLMKLIQLPIQALEERIQEELEENPALEEGDNVVDDEVHLEMDAGEDDSQKIDADDIDIDAYLSDDEIPEYRLQANNYSADDEEPRMQSAGVSDFYEQLREQLSLVGIEESIKNLAVYLIGCIEDDGYIRRPLDRILDDLAFSENIFVELSDLEKALTAVQSLEPAGIGARDLKECLLLQLERKRPTAYTSMAIEILESHFEEFTNKRYNRILQRLEIDEENLKLVIREITQLNPKPGNSMAQGGNTIGQALTPDFSIQIRDGDLELQLNGRNLPELNVSREYRDMLQTYKEQRNPNKQTKEAVLFVKQKIDSAKWFVDAVRQRQQTLMLVMGAIMEKQEAYFLSGDERDLKPMILKDIAEMTGMDISTISRVASNKYVQTPYGTFLIKTLFSESMTNDQGEEVSTREIKKILEELIAQEDKRQPLADELLAIALKEHGYPIARRTIAKYREQLNIPTARLRKEL